MSQSVTMYAVVYGSEWEDVLYFTDLYKAKQQLLKASWKNRYFSPLIMVFNECDGILRPEDYIYVVNKDGLINAEDLYTYKYLHDNYDEFMHLIQQEQW